MEPELPFNRILSFKIVNHNLSIGLPKYRNGGRFVDLDVLKLKPRVLKLGLGASGQDLPIFSATGGTIVG